MTLEKAIYILETYPEDKSSWEDTIEAFNFAANALRNVSQWISVEEKLPEQEQEQEYVLTYVDDDVHHQIALYKDGVWLSTNGSEICPTHWMPLPKEPTNAQLV